MINMSDGEITIGAGSHTSSAEVFGGTVSDIKIFTNVTKEQANTTSSVNLTLNHLWGSNMVEHNDNIYIFGGVNHLNKLFKFTPITETKTMGYFFAFF